MLVLKISIDFFARRSSAFGWKLARGKVHKIFKKAYIGRLKKIRTCLD